MSESQARIAKQEREEREAVKQRQSSIETAPMLAAVLLMGFRDAGLSARSEALRTAYELMDEAESAYEDFQAVKRSEAAT